MIDTLIKKFFNRFNSISYDIISRIFDFPKKITNFFLKIKSARLWILAARPRDAFLEQVSGTMKKTSNELLDLPFDQYARYRDVQEIVDRLRTGSERMKILDVGGEHYTWPIIGRCEGITIINVNIPKETEGFEYILGSGCAMPFKDKSFDLAFSHSAIEQRWQQRKSVPTLPYS